MVNPEAGLAYLGSQGDIWDAQKDMGLAGLGALVTMALIALVNWRYDPAFGAEFRESLRVKSHMPLGELRLRELIRAGRRVRRRL